MKQRTKLQQNLINIPKNKAVETTSLNPIINIYQTKSEMLFNHKSFLEILLGLIKKAQVDYLTNNKSNENNNKNHNISIMKQVLNDLKQSLIEIKKEKEKKEDLFQKQKEKKKSNLKKIVFNTVYTKRSVSNFNYINTNFETLITENNENYYNNETPELKLLNFKVENEIKKVENLIRRITFLIQYYKTPHLIKDHRTEIICDDKRSNESMNNLLHQKLIQQREKFIEVVNLKTLQDLRINTIQSQTIGYKNAMKDIQKSYKYVNTQEIITEENKSYLETINDNEKNEEDLKKSNNSDIEKNINKSDNNVNSKNVKLIDMNEVEKLLKLNMNINVNINYNKQYINNHFENSNKSDNEEEEEEENYSNYSKEENIDEDLKENKIKEINNEEKME